jgi:hypothetical protein
VVLPDSYGISRAPYYLGVVLQRVPPFTSTGVIPSVPGLSMPFDFDDNTTGQFGRTDEDRSHDPTCATSAEYHTHMV